MACSVCTMQGRLPCDAWLPDRLGTKRAEQELSQNTYVIRHTLAKASHSKHHHCNVWHQFSVDSEDLLSLGPWMGIMRRCFWKCAIVRSFCRPSLFRHRHLTASITGAGDASAAVLFAITHSHVARQQICSMLAYLLASTCSLVHGHLE